jgi:preprotein translocase subunit SecE
MRHNCGPLRSFTETFRSTVTEDKPEKVSAARPTGKRQLAGVSTTSTSSYEAKNAVAVDGDEKKGNKVTSFLPEVVEEMKKVIWPTAKQMVNYTIIVFAFLILMTALVAGVDFLAGLGVEKVLTP